MASAYGITQFCFSKFFVAFQVASLGVDLAEAGLRLAIAQAGGVAGLLVLAAGVLMGVTAVGWNGVILAEAARLAPPGRVGAATSALSFCFGATMLVAPPGFSVLIWLTGGYTAGFLMCALAAVVGMVAIAGRRR